MLVFQNRNFQKKVLDRLRSYIKNKKHKMTNELAGNINSSYDLEDKENWFLKTF